MTNIFQLGMTAWRERDHIERALKLGQPVLDAYNAHRDVVDKAKKLMEEADKLKAEAMPILEAYQAVDDELIPLVASISQAFYPHEVKQSSKPIHVPAEGFNVRWLQQSLIDLAKAGKFEWVDEYVHPVTKKKVRVRQDKFVDDDPGENTKVEVKAYQDALVDRGVPGWKRSNDPKDNDVDGWAGMKTCAAIYNDLASP